eukprot:Nitzschia sp. Nitz4//scaffold68_size99682//91398//95434//NITZ4_004577-RA/size99682-snap-gene-0.6-mRNA-1//1//CDS//3329556632//2436//frame0
MVTPTQRNQVAAVSNHTARWSRDYSHSTAFTSLSQRRSSGTFAVTSVDVPGFNIQTGDDDQESTGQGSSDPSTSASLHRDSFMSETPQIPSKNNEANRKARLSKILVRKETKQIHWLRIVTLSLFFVAACSVSLAAYFTTTAYQREIFEERFEGQAQQIADEVLGHFYILLQELEQWSIPYQQEYTITPSFQNRMESMMQMTKTNWVAMAPYIDKSDDTQDSLQQWQDYVPNATDLWLDADEAAAVVSEVFPTTNNDVALPLWQHVPTDPTLVNWDTLASPSVLPQELSLSLLTDPPTIVLGQYHNISGIAVDQALESMMYYPILTSTETDENTVTAVIMASLNWTTYLQPPQFLDASANGIACRLESFCGIQTEIQYYQITSTSSGESSLEFLDKMPPARKAELEVSVDLVQAIAEFSESSLQTSMNFQQDYCSYQLHITPTEEVYEYHVSYHAAAYTASIACVFIFCGGLFLVYDCLVERRQRKVMKSATKTHEIVAGLFPETVRNRLFSEEQEQQEDKKSTKFITFKEPKGTEKSMDLGANEYVLPQKPDLTNADFGVSERTTASTGIMAGSRPIADLFPNATVMFADIAGFTAWSSVRDPTQVFTLLEAIYAAFDQIAEQREVFKVETIGDCYVAVTGLPKPQEEHALIMVKFARDCMKTMQRLARSLEVELGPDTGDLCIRVGLNSGPVTAGVLRGQKSRFQLFGDTVNMASRMESNGLPNQIQCSQQTADLLKEADKGHWIRPRKDLVHAKGKGFVQTFWIVSPIGPVMGEHQPKVDNKMTNIEDDHSDITEESLGDHVEAQIPQEIEAPEEGAIDPHLQRLIDWNVDTLSRIIKTIVATRRTRRSLEINQQVRAFGGIQRSFSMQKISMDGSVMPMASRKLSDFSVKSNALKVTPNSNPRDEYCESIHLPHYDPGKKIKRASSLAEEKLDDRVMNELRQYVTTIACAYNDNPFHNFEHASHVAMSANKILKRVVNAEHVRVRRSSLDNLASKMHDFTYGITSDPLTHFACLFSALIHDVDHPGISNAQMLKEKHPLAEVYDGKSIAEQNSFEFAWELLMDTECKHLRTCLFENEDEVKRFRQLVINSLMATDVFDPDLVKLRNERWRKAFPDPNDESGTLPPCRPSEHMDLKATVVIEQIIQASDVAHTMQHWHVYQKWNKRLFREMYTAYQSGRSPTDPAKSWYNGELWFYDNYIIPLAKKLEECRVFGSSSDEFLTYAMDNRSEWKTKGRALVERMVASCKNEADGLEFSNLHQSSNTFDSLM